MELVVTIAMLPLPDDIKADTSFEAELNSLIENICFQIKAHLQWIWNDPPDRMKTDLEKAAAIEAAARFYLQNSPAQASAQKWFLFYDQDAYLLFARYMKRTLDV